MSTLPGVRVHAVWKRFRQDRHDALRDLLAAALHPLNGKRVSRRGEPIRGALRDVSFDVNPGEVLGIVGPNGAGKSTLLKLLNGVLRPTSGTVEVRGRVGALIDVAAGFHGDLTGRENVYLQGSVLGMSRAEVARHFDQIVDFSGVADFIDTPVKRYSSGMSARLGFAIAAHLDVDVLLVDEVLSVGDLAFRHKAEERMRHLIEREVPIVLVTHQLDRVLALCRNALLLVRGEVRFNGPADECVKRYVEGEHLLPDPGETEPWFRLLETVGPAGPVGSGDPISVRVGALSLRPRGDDPAIVALAVRGLPEEDTIFATHTEACGVQLPECGAFELEIALTMNVAAGVYRVQPFIWDQRERKEIARGRSVLVHVEKRTNSFGRVDLRPRMQVLIR
ncbi:MAG TPA: ABC transporter ATP-binding protein [Longimicrobiales bacterium]|nr:ABC transporter ATP-binding protein [Longimicrobiales bacterium]